LQAWRRELAKRGSDRLTYLRFDLLYLDGNDLRRVPLFERKQPLKEVLTKAPAKITFSETFESADRTTQVEEGFHPLRPGR
jgi:ATP-dependent DNA ligase